MKMFFQGTIISFMNYILTLQLVSDTICQARAEVFKITKKTWLRSLGFLVLSEDDKVFNLLQGFLLRHAAVLHISAN